MKNFYKHFEHLKEQEYIIDEFIKIYNSENYKTIKSKVKHSYNKDLCKFIYYYRVYEMTEKNAYFVKNIERCSCLFHLDHIIPIEIGYKYGIDYNIIGSVDNLQIISLQENFKKSNTITKQVKNMFSFFNIKVRDLVTINHPLITKKKKLIEEQINKLSNPSISLYPKGGDW